jgi:hypothetical protein
VREARELLEYGVIPSKKVIDGVPEADLLFVSDAWRNFAKQVEQHWMPTLEQMMQHASELKGMKDWGRMRRHVSALRKQAQAADELVRSRTKAEKEKEAEQAGKAAGKADALTLHLYRDYAVGRDMFNKIMETWGMTGIVKASKASPGYKAKDLGKESSPQMAQKIVAVTERLMGNVEASLDRGLKVSRLFRTAARKGEMTLAQKKAAAQLGGAFEKSISSAFYRGPRAVLKRTKEWLDRLKSYQRYEAYEAPADRLYLAEMRRDLRVTESSLERLLRAFERELGRL